MSEVIPLPISSLQHDSQSSALAIPVDIVPAILYEPVALGIKRAHALNIQTPEDYKAAGELVNMLKKFDTSIKTRALDLGRPFREQAAAITAEGEKFRAPIEPAYKLAAAKMKAYNDAELAKVAAAEEAQRQERIKAEQAAQALADTKARLEREALAAEQAAAKKLENATSEKAKEKAIADLQAAQAKLAEAEALPDPSSIPFIPQAPLPTVTAAKGVKMSKRVNGLWVDKTKIPAAYLEVNEALVKKHILDGVIAQGQYGVKFTIEEFIAGTGR